MGLENVRLKMVSNVRIGEFFLTRSVGVHAKVEPQRLAIGLRRFDFFFHSLSDSHRVLFRHFATKKLFPILQDLH